MVWNTPATWAAGAILTAAQLNAQVRDNFKAIGDPSTAYTPTWTSTGTAPVIGNGSMTGGYNVAGKRLWLWIQLTAGSTTTFGTGSWIFGLPAGLVLAPGAWNFQANAIDTSAGGIYPLFGRPSSGGIALRALPTTAGNPLASINNTTPFTWANTDSLFINGSAELA